MRAKNFVVLLALGVFGLIIGCMSTKNAPFPIYKIAIELVDKAGNNISELAANNTTGEVGFDLIDIEGEVTYDADSVKLSPCYYSQVKEDNICYFILKTDGDGPGHGQPALTWKLKCKEIFGDDNVHIIESKWDSRASSKDRYKRCLSFELEGQTYIPKMKNGEWTARVVINR